MSVSAIPTAGQAVDGVVLLGGRASELRLGAAVDLYLGYQRRRGRTRETIRSASSMLGPFVAWAGSDTHVAQITRASVELEFFAEWYEEFEARHGYPPSTSTSRCLLGTIKCLFQFLYEFDLLRLPDGTPARNPLTRLDIPPAAPPRQNALKPEAAAALLAAAQTPRERIILNLLRWTGMRAGEAAALTTTDIDLDRREIHIRVSKTQRGIRSLPLLDPLGDPLQQWLAYRDESDPACDSFLITGRGSCGASLSMASCPLCV